MPCYDPEYKHSKGDAILCSIFHQEEKGNTLNILIDELDYDLIGLSKQQVWDWWRDHKELDKQKMKEKS